MVSSLDGGPVTFPGLGFWLDFVFGVAAKFRWLGIGVWKIVDVFDVAMSPEVGRSYCARARA